MRLLTFFLVGMALASGPTSAQDLSALLTKLRNATVFLEIHFVDPNKPIESCPAGPNEGTGFVVTPNGGLITAQHIFEPTKDCEAYTDIRVEARPGYRSTASPTPATVVLTDESADIVALRLGAKQGSYDYLETCFIDLPAQGTKLLAMGFPVGQDFTGLEVIFQNFNIASGRWNVSADFAFGMSGGPVVDLSGRVVGVIKGGVRGTPAARFVTPLGWALGALGRIGEPALPACGDLPNSVPVIDPSPSPPRDLATFLVSARITAFAQQTRLIRERFSHEFANDASCTEGWQTRSLPACLPGGTKIDRIEGPIVNSAGHDGQSWYEPDPSQENCVSLIYGYSDRGRNLSGECRGHGWISADWVVEGEGSGPTQKFEHFSEGKLEVVEGDTTPASATFPPDLNERTASAIQTDWTYRLEVSDEAGDPVAELSDTAPTQGNFQSEQTSNGTVIIRYSP